MDPGGQSDGTPRQQRSLGNRPDAELGLGLAGVNAIGTTEPAVQGLRDAVDFIAELRQASDFASIPVGRRVVVVGGGMTAVDAAVQSRKLGAEEVTMVYRRGAQDMPASGHEQNWARTRGVTIRHWAAPKEVLSAGGKVTGMRFAATHMEAGKLVIAGWLAAHWRRTNWKMRTVLMALVAGLALINAAGVFGKMHRIERVRMDQWDREVNIDLRGTFLVARSVGVKLGEARRRLGRGLLGGGRGVLRIAHRVEAVAALVGA